MSKRGKPRTGKTTRERRREARSADAAAPDVESDPTQPDPTFPVISDHAGLTAMGHDQRRRYLGQFTVRSTLHTLASIQSRLDVAATTDWSEDRVERQLIAESGAEWATRLAPLVGSTHRLIPPRSMTQLIREALEHGDDNGGELRDIGIADALTLVMSITTEHAANQNPLDAVANPDPAQVQEQLAAIAAYTDEENVAANRQQVLVEMANLLSNEAVKLELIKASTYDLWFRPWPGRVTDTRIGATPAEAFELANHVSLLNVMVVGQIITDGVTGGQFEFTREELVRAGGSADAVDFVITHMAYDSAGFTKRLRQDRARGPVADQRYVFTERPLLLNAADTVLVLRYQWMIDRFFGAQLYWQTFFMFGPAGPGSVAEAFSQAINYAFERVAGDILEKIAANSSKITRLVSETEMQAEWTEVRGQTPSVCDFMLVAGRACILIDATNHHLSANLAQGLADIDTFNADIESSFVTTKFNQIVSTAKLVREHLSFGVEADPAFIPYVVVPNNGLSNTTSVQLDWMNRAAAPFAELLGSTRAPVPLRISDLALFEGLADYFSTPGRDIADLLGGWATHQPFPVPVSLRELLNQLNMPAPIPRRMIRDQQTLDRLIQLCRRGDRE